MPTYFRSKQEYFTLFRNLCAAHPGQADFVSIGKSYLGNDIWMARIGNPAGGKVYWQASTHGWEDMGAEVMYLYAKWLLETNSQQTNDILNGNYTLLVPIFNVDTYAKRNGDYSVCQYGVDLNRNFPASFGTNACNPTDYHGPRALSEPEAAAVYSMLQTYRPTFFMDAHYGGGGVTGTGMCYSTMKVGTTWVGTDLANQFVARYKELAKQYGVPAYWVSMNAPGSGFVATAAASLGCTAFLFELAGEAASPGGLCFAHTAPGQSLADIKNTWFPKCLPLFLAMSDLCKIAQAVKYNLTVSSAHGTVGGAGLYDRGSTAYASVSPLTVPFDGGQYVFTGWSGDASGTSSPSNPIVMDRSKTATANWQTQYLPKLTIRMRVEETSTEILGKTVTLNSTFIGYTPAVYTVDLGITYQVHIAGTLVGGTYDGYLFTRWDDCPTCGNTRPVTINGDTTITAYYRAPPHPELYVTMRLQTTNAELTGRQVTVDGTTVAYTPAVFTWAVAGVHTVRVAGTLGTGQKFSRWSDGVTTNSRTVTVTVPVSLVAYYT